MGSLVEVIENFLLENGFEQTYWLGYSGGLDSHVLLHVLVQLKTRYPIKLHAVHVHHGLSEQADGWLQQCAKQCEEWQVNFISRVIDLKKSNGKNIEEQARNLRYRVFEELLAPNDFLLTAHHQDDQAETFLLQMLRGAGPKGLSAMPKQKLFARGILARPLLDLTRDDLTQYALEKNLTWIEDESNTNVKLTRNFLRHHVLPTLKTRWPSVSSTLSRVAEHCADAQNLLNEMAQQDLIAVQGSTKTQLSLTQLLQLSPLRQRNVLRLWLTQLNFPLPSVLKMQHIQNDLLHARGDKSPLITWGEVELRRYQNEIYVMPSLNQHDSKRIFKWNIHEPLWIPNIGTLVASKTDCLSSSARSILLSGDITVRFRQGGETLLEGQHHYSLKKRFQEWKVPTWVRDRIPLIYKDNILAVVLGFYVNEIFLASEYQEGYFISLKIK